jgi:hypothetical protein
MMSCDCNVEDITTKIFKQSCQFHISIIHETNVILLDSLADDAADPHTTTMELKSNFYPKDFRQSDSQKVFQLDRSDWEMELSFILIKQTEKQQNKELTDIQSWWLRFANQKEHELDQSFNLKFQTCVSAQVLLRPNLPGHLGVFFPGPLACLPCWLEAKLLTHILNCSQINHGPGYWWTAAGQRHCLAN